MKKIAALLSGLIMFSTCTIGFLPVQAGYTFEPEQIEEYFEQYGSGCVLEDDGVFYGTEGDIYMDYVPEPGTFDCSFRLLALMYKYPEGRFAVDIKGWPEYVDTFDPQEEIERLRQNGIEVSVMSASAGVTTGRLYAILNAEQIENFPVDETVGYLMGLAEKPVEDTAPKHTFESELSEEQYEQILNTYSAYYLLGDDGVFYTTPEHWDFINLDYVPKGDTFDRSALLSALVHKYPEGRFAVQFWGWAGNGYEETFSTQEELERLRRNGIEASVIEAVEDDIDVMTGMLYAVLDAEQLENFPVDETVGYLMGLAAKPAEVTVVAGDINMDDEVGLLDVVYLQKYLLKAADFNENQWVNADINLDGEVDVFDLALLKRKIIKK